VRNLPIERGHIDPKGLRHAQLGSKTMVFGRVHSAALEGRPGKSSGSITLWTSSSASKSKGSGKGRANVAPNTTLRDPCRDRQPHLESAFAFSCWRRSHRARTPKMASTMIKRRFFASTPGFIWVFSGESKVRSPSSFFPSNLGEDRRHVYLTQMAIDLGVMFRLD
jgi:hypothetical protein